MNILLALVVAFSITSSLAEAITYQQLTKMAEFENLGNPAFNYEESSPYVMELEHFEIPLSALKSFDIENIPVNIRRELIFMKHGEPHIRWLINPNETAITEDFLKDYNLKHNTTNTDRGRHLKLAAWLKSKNLDAQKYKYFKGFFTASRSFFVSSPDEKTLFSVKTSTKWIKGRDFDSLSIDKSYTSLESEGEGHFYDYLQERLRENSSETFSYLNEPAHFAIEEEKELYRDELGRRNMDRMIYNLSEGLSVRSLDPENNPRPELFTIPGFSALHDKYGLMIAEANGYKENPTLFLHQVYKQLGRAAVDLAARTGLTSHSNHAQNFRLEVDENLKWTGRIIFIDMADANYWPKFMDKIGVKLPGWPGGPRPQEYLIFKLYEVFTFAIKRAPTWFVGTGKDLREQFEAGISEQVRKIAPPVSRNGYPNPEDIINFTEPHKPGMSCSKLFLN